MHELSLISSLFQILEEKAGEQKAVKVTSVTIKAGKLSGAVPELLRSAFQAFKKGTIASRAKLRIEIVPVKLRCRTCGREWTAGAPVLACPSCASAGLEILEGRDIFLEKFEIER